MKTMIENCCGQPMFLSYIFVVCYVSANRMEFHIHGIKGFATLTKSFVKIGTAKIFCYNNKMLFYQQNVWLLLQNFWFQQQKK